MKRGLIVGGTLIVALGIWLYRAYPPRQHGNVKIQHHAEALNSYGQAPSALTRQGQPNVPVPIPAVAKATASEPRSFEELEHEFRELDATALEAALEQSKHQVSALGLIEKANQGPLNSQDQDTLRMELRKQGVLSVMLAQIQMREFEKRYN